MLWALNRLVKVVPIQLAEEGQALVEYALILGLISVVAIAVLTSIGSDIVNVLSTIESSLQSAV